MKQWGEEGIALVMLLSGLEEVRSCGDGGVSLTQGDRHVLREKEGRVSAFRYVLLGGGRGENL